MLRAFHGRYTGKSYWWGWRGYWIVKRGEAAAESSKVKMQCVKGVKILGIVERERVKVTRE